MPDSPQTTWNELAAWLTRWYHEPDIEALKICFCALLSHFYPDEPPLWILMIGPSGAGKTDIVAQCLVNIPGAQIIGDLTPKCFLSGMQHAKEEPSLLVSGGPSQLWISKEFTSFASMRYEDRALVAAQLRNVWDGEVTTNTGAGRRAWKGKVSFLAVAPPEFEDHWAALRGLGERFITLRWRGPVSRKEINERMRKANGHRIEIRERVKQYVMRLFEQRWQTNIMPASGEMEQLDTTSELVCWLQTPVERYSDRDRSIKRRPDVGMPSRIGFALSQIVRTYNDVFHNEPGAVNLAARLALDTIPPERREVLSTVPFRGSISYRQIKAAADIPETTLRRTIEDMQWLKILKFPDEGKKWPDRETSLKDDFREMLSRSLLVLPRTTDVVEIRTNFKHKGSFINY